MKSLLSVLISWPPKMDGEDEKEYIKKMNAFHSKMRLWLKKYGDELAFVQPCRGLPAGITHFHCHFFCVNSLSKFQASNGEKPS